jgi:integrase
MPRKARDEKLDTRTVRLKLAVRREPYWRVIQEGRAIGYRRLPGGKSGTWVARHYDKVHGRQYQSLGNADDLQDADGADCLTFAHAQAKAAEWFLELSRTAGKVTTPITVREAVESYLTDFEARGGKNPKGVRASFAAHIMPNLGDKVVNDLSAKVIRDWHHALAIAPARLRTSPKAKKQKVRKVDASDAEGRRARRASANRLLTNLKAALNHAFREGTAASDDAWRRVKPFAQVDAPRVRYLIDEEVTRLVNACPADLRKLVIAALLTACRYGELTMLRPIDIDLAARVLTVRVSKSGKPRHVALTDEAKRFFEALAAGKKRDALLLVRDDGGVWGKSHQSRPLREACKNAKIAPAISFHILRHTYASRLAMRGVPMPVIAAQLGHADVKITIRHYAHLSPGYIAETVRAAFGDLGLVPAETNVKAIRPANA